MTDNLFRELYKKLGLINEKEQLLSLHINCPNCDICWKNAKDRMPKQEDNFWTITRPWIGEKYKKQRLLIVGENMNEYGGYDGAINLTKWAKEQIENGAIKTFKSPTYSGSFVFHRMGSYATAILNHERFIECQEYSTWPNPKDISNSFEHIAFTNQIKCSPIGQKSEQTYEMWDNCGKFILRQELEILEPKSILVLGTSDNFNYLNMNVLDNPISVTWDGKLGFGIGKINSKETKLYVVPHPASFGGNNKRIMSDLIACLKNWC